MRQEKSEEEFPDDNDTGEAGSRRWKIFGLIFILVIALSGVTAWGVLQEWRTRQARQMVLGVEEFSASGHQREALLRVQAAWRMRPDDPQVMWAMARVLEACGNPKALDAYQKFTAIAEVSAADREQYLRAALRFKRMDLAEGQAQVLARSGEDGFAHLVKAEQLLAKGKTAAAEGELRTVGAASAAKDSALLRLASILAAKGPAAPDARSEAFAILSGLSDRKDAMGLEALAIGCATGVLPPAEVQSWENRLAQHPLANDRTFLLLQTSRWPEDKDGRQTIVQGVMARFAGAPVERKTAALLWLNEHQEFSRSLELMSEAKARTNPDAFVLWLDALVGRGDWTAIDLALSKKGPLGDSLVDLFRARAASHTGRAGTARQMYQRAIHLALADLAQMPLLLAFLNADGQQELLVSALQEALAGGQDQKVAADVLLQVSKQSRNAVEMREAWSAIARARPEDAAAANAAIYYSLVTGIAPPATLAERAGANPSDINLCTIRALALLKEGKSKEAVGIFEGMSLRSDQLTPEQKAAVVSVLAASGRLDQAEAMGATLDASALTTQEVQMVEGYLGR